MVKILFFKSNNIHNVSSFKIVNKTILCVYIFRFLIFNMNNKINQF